MHVHADTCTYAHAHAHVRAHTWQVMSARRASMAPKITANLVFVKANFDAVFPAISASIEKRYVEKFGPNTAADE